MIKKFFSVTILVSILIACSSKDETKEPAPTPQQPLAKSNNSEAFNTQFADLLKNYYALKEAFVKEDTAIINKTAKALQTSTDSLNLANLQADSSILLTMQSDKESLIANIKGVIGEVNIDEKRKDFAMLGEFVYGLFRTSRYDKEKLYKQRCPMAFNNKGAEWLSNAEEIRNPYLPKTMLECGENIDSVDYRPAPSTPSKN